MNNYPKYIEVKGIRYPINTDFRIALECEEIVKSDIGDYEKALAVIYKLFGEKALNDFDNQEEILNLAVKYLWCGKSKEGLINDDEPSMDFKQDEGYIKASFRSDYQIDLDNEKMHWWEFNDLLGGFTENSIINRVRYVREEPLKDKKGEELQRWLKMKAQVALKQEKTKEQKELDILWEKKMKKEG